MKFQTEQASQPLFDEISPLLQEHWQEIRHYPDIPLDPDWNAYLSMQAAGRLRVFTARVTATGELAGYAIYFVGPHPHYKSTVFAVQDILFVHPNFRHNATGARLILWCDQQLKAEGVQVAVQHVKVAHDFSPMLERLGYETMDKILVRRL